MSLINKVLRDLDARHASVEAGGKLSDVRIPAAISFHDETSWISRVPKVFSVVVLAVISIGIGWWWITTPTPSAPASPPITSPAKSVDIKPTIISAETSKKLAQELSRPEEQPEATSPPTAKLLSARERANNEYRNGYVLMQQGQANEAALQFRAALSTDITHISARNGLLLILMEGNRHGDAQTILQAGIALQPVHLPWVISLARLYLEQSNATKAWTLLQTHMKAGKASADFQGICGVVLQKLGRMKEAGTYYKTATQLAPSNPNWWVGLGLTREAAGRTEAAKEAFRTAHNLPGDLPPGLSEFINQRLKSP